MSSFVEYPFLKGWKLLRTQSVNFRGCRCFLSEVAKTDRYAITSPKIETQTFINFDPFKKGYSC